MTLTVVPVHGLPEFAPGDDLAGAIASAADLVEGDVVVVAQKVISKIEGALVDPPAVPAGADPRRELARRVAAEVVADAPWALIVRTHHGFVCANAGIDASNVPGGQLSLLPDDPDASARRLREDLRRRAGVDVAVVVSDTFGRPWRIGQTDVAIGLAGMAALRDERGGSDRNGQVLTVTEVALADEIAAAADLVRRKAEGLPVVIVRGLEYEASAAGAATDLVRPGETDLFSRGRGMLPALLRRPLPDGVRPIDEDDVAAVRSVAAGQVVQQGPPTAISVENQFAAGLAAAVLVDRGALVRWEISADRVILECGRPPADR